jgi:pimeloyl-ACP methyl ester carboxylesterase
MLLLRQFHGSRKIILMYMPEVTMRIPSSSPIFTKQEMIAGVTKIFATYAIKSATFIGHSFGTTCISWFVNDVPTLVQSAYFIDPVCFLLNEPDVCYNFMYRRPQNAIQIVFAYFAGKELGISTVLARHFWWYYATKSGLITSHSPKYCRTRQRFGSGKMIRLFMHRVCTITFRNMGLKLLTGPVSIMVGLFSTFVRGLMWLTLCRVRM